MLADYEFRHKMKFIEHKVKGNSTISYSRYSDNTPGLDSTSSATRSLIQFRFGYTGSRHITFDTLSL